MLTLVLADAELEQVPGAIHDHPQVTSPAHRRDVDPERLLLDSNVHHHAMRDAELDEHRRRGRPDIAHLFLLTVLESTLNLEGGLRTILHTRNDERIDVAPETRIPRSTERFKGLLEAVFEEGQAGPPDRDPLLAMTSHAPLSAILKQAEPDHVIGLDPGGDRVEPTDEIPHLAGEHDDVAVVLGGFPRGDYASPVDTLADELWSVHDDRLVVWSAASEIVVPWRRLTEGISPHRGPAPER